MQFNLGILNTIEIWFKKETGTITCNWGPSLSKIVMDYICDFGPHE